MAERLEVDPTKIPAPNFASGAYAFMRIALIADANTPEITTEELAAQRLKAQWEAHIEGLKVQYEAQLQEAEALREQRRQEAADAERLAAAEQQEKERELAKESEKKRLPIYSFQKGVGVDYIPLQLHPYAKKMMTARKYVPLWYFLPDAATEAKERSKDSLDTNHLQFAVEDGDTLSGSTVSLVGSHTVRASPNAIPDSRLSWSQVMRAKSAFLDALGLGTWPDNYVSMFASFYINMDMHRELQEQDGDRVMAHYHAEMRQAWYDAMERKEPFDLSVISDRVVGESRREIVKQRQEKSLKGKQLALEQTEASSDDHSSSPQSHTSGAHLTTQTQIPRFPTRATANATTATNTIATPTANATPATMLPLLPVTTLPSPPTLIATMTTNNNNANIYVNDCYIIQQ
ncbi:hypothetical protein C8R41DRAFT_867626 [Lentinula lateritia]|uniref:Uncharacterized protein n=1 Tax=Lentinula lateritia TaxID=40482 RepID=A0ABQ8VE91_9AGAR|nr:hypothetical protein C8R41DRAFT_867626 [Lentinula lateritia]